MAVPKRRTSRSKTRKRRSHHHLPVPNIMSCKKCGEAVPTHYVCPNCGHYRGREVVKVEEK